MLNRGDVFWEIQARKWEKCAQYRIFLGFSSAALASRVKSAEPCVVCLTNGRVRRAIIDMAIAQDVKNDVRLYSMSRQLQQSRKA
jgi:hypothetical protein